jgi:hypothetical protein
MAEVKSSWPTPSEEAMNSPPMTPRDGEGAAGFEGGEEGGGEGGDRDVAEDVVAAAAHHLDDLDEFPFAQAQAEVDVVEDGEGHTRDGDVDLRPGADAEEQQEERCEGDLGPRRPARRSTCRRRADRVSPVAWLRRSVPRRSAARLPRSPRSPSPPWRSTSFCGTQPL